MAEKGMTLSALLKHARVVLNEAGITEPAVDARLLVEHFTDTSRTDAVARPDLPIGPESVSAVVAALEKRRAGMPVHRILGRREFWGLMLALSTETLEPRADTEALVELVLDAVGRRQGTDHAWRILDLGTGTGAIALALLSALPNARALATDISSGALATARRNAEANGMDDRFRTCESDWFSAVRGTFDIIVSNPPYISEAEWADLAVEVREHDPYNALIASENGLLAYRMIAESCRKHLSEGGIVGVEIGHNQRPQVSAIFARNGFGLAGEKNDLEGHCRALSFTA